MIPKSGHRFSDQIIRQYKSLSLTMRGERRGDMMRTGTTMAALLGLALALGGCGGSMFGSSSLDLFSTSSKATTEASAAGVGGDAAATTDIECPSGGGRTGAATLLSGS